jgi:hypothetical protein
MDPDPDPGDPKAYGSGFGFATLSETVLFCSGVLSASTTTRCARRVATPSRRRETAPPDGQSRYYRRTVTLSGESRCFGAVFLESGSESSYVGKYGSGAGSRFFDQQKLEEKKF